MKSVTDFFGTMVFNDEVMKARLPEDVYNAIQNTIQNGKRLDLSLANQIAGAMKDTEDLGGYCSGVTPLPIPNREVKTGSADGTGQQPGE